MDIKELLKQETDNGKLITELMNGRNTGAPAVDTYQAQLDPEKHDVMDETKRPDKWVKVDEEDKADYSANDLKVVTDTSDPNKTQVRKRREAVARIAVALQKLIVKRAVSFCFGNAITLNADIEDGSREADVLKAVRKVLTDAKGRTINRAVARAIFSCTEGAELWYPVEKPTKKYGFNSTFKLRCKVLSPLKGDVLYPYFDDTGDLTAFSRQFAKEDNNHIKHTYFETYTDEEHYIWENKQSGWELLEGYPKANPIGKIPVVYGQQPQVEWADVQSLIDRLEKLLSNFADTNDYHASPKIVVKGEILRWSKKGDSGSVIEMDEDGSADYLTWSQAPESVKLEIETLLKLIYTLTQTPDISFDSVKGLNVSGIALELLFMDAHLKVMDKCEIFDEYLQRRMAILQAYLAQMNKGDREFSEACETLIIEPEITPYMIKDEQSTVNLLSNATGNKQLVSRRRAVEVLGWAEDVDKEIEQIEEEENATSGMADLFNQEPTE